METLIIYKSKHGTGREVAAYLQRKFCVGLQEADPVLSWEGYERVVCVRSIYTGRLVRQLPAYIRVNTKELAGKSVGMLLRGISDAASERIIAEDLGEACYRQLAFSANVGGRLDLQKLGFLERKVIRMVNKQEHLYEDRDTVLVDRLRWDTIDNVIAGQTYEA